MIFYREISGGQQCAAKISVWQAFVEVWNNQCIFTF